MLMAIELAQIFFVLFAVFLETWFALGGKMDVTINHGECQPREKQKQSADVMFGHMTKEADHGTRMGIGRWERIPP